MLAKEFIQLNLADDIRIVILPIILGDGTPFVDHVGQEHALHLKDVTAYKSGLVELWYEIRKDNIEADKNPLSSSNESPQ